MMASKKLKYVNNILAVIVVLVCLYAMALPLLPNIRYYAGNVAGQKNKLSSTTIETPPQDNRLMIEKIGVNASINEGNDLSALNNGSWR